MRRVFVFIISVGIISAIFSCNKPTGKVKKSSFAHKPLVVKLDTTVRRNYVNSEYHFRIWLPKKPETQIDTVKFDSLDIIYKTYYVDMRDSFFMLTVVNYPKSVIQGQDEATILLNAHHKAMTAQNMSTDFEQLDTLSGLPVLFYKVYSTDIHMVGMNLFKGTMMYQLFLANLGKTYPAQKTINRFLGTFQILDEN